MRRRSVSPQENTVAKSGWWRLVAVVVIAIALTACGATKKEQGGQTTATPRAARAADADVTSGCWTPADRKTRSQGGTNQVARDQRWQKAPAMAIDPAKKYTAQLETNKGTIDVEFYPKDAPQTVNNFICLARAGYYDGTPFHRIIAGFVIQGGDPTGTGTGSPGYTFADEPIHRDYVKGTLAMANSGKKDTNGSQFFIVLDNLTARGALAKKYTVFGQVTGGQDVVDKIAQTPTKPDQQGEQSVPIEPVTLQKVTIGES